MLRIGLINPDLNVNIGPKVVNLLHIEPPGQTTSPENLENLTVPWRNLQQHPDVLSFLSWHTQISEFHGRDPEMGELERWAAETTQAVSIKFVCGGGGVGKSRLAAQFATQMQSKEWAAGFVDLRRPGAFPMTEEGTLLVVDYPEENREGVTELLTDLSNLDLSHRLRVLFLSRRTIDDWQDVIEYGNAVDLVDRMPVVLGAIAGPASYELFCSAQERAAEQCNTNPLPLSEAALTHWLEQAPENDRALFIVALGVHSAFLPQEEVVRFTGRQVLEALVRRELGRLRRSAKKAGTDHLLAFARLLAMAAIADRIPVARAIELAKSGDLQLGFPQHGNIEAMIAGAEITSESEIGAPKPDIVAAAFTGTVLAEEPDLAPGIVWAALEPDVEGGLRRLERLCYDAEIVLEMAEHRLSLWLAEALEGNPERCALLKTVFVETQLPLGWIDAAVSFWRTMLDCTEDEAATAEMLNNLSVDLAADGDVHGALGAIEESVEISRRLVKADPARYEPGLAGSLNTLSTSLASIGASEAALRAIEEAVEIQRPLVKADPAQHESDLALSLNNLFAVRSNIGAHEAALEAAQEALEIRRRLAKANPTGFEAQIATSLSNLSLALRSIADPEAALGAIEEAVEIHRRLALANPARFETHLALSLSNLAISLSDAGDPEAALGAIEEAVEIHRRLARVNPARYEPDLARSLNNLSLRLGNTGDHKAARRAVQEATVICRRLAKADPARHEPELAMSLNNLGLRLVNAGDREPALGAIREAVEIYRRLAKITPARFEPDLSMSIGSVGTVLRAGRQFEKAISAFSEGIIIIEPHARAMPQGPPARMLASLEADLKRTQEMMRSGEGQ